MNDWFHDHSRFEIFSDVDCFKFRKVTSRTNFKQKTRFYFASTRNSAWMLESYAFQMGCTCTIHNEYYFFIVRRYPFLDAYSDINYVWCYIHLSHGGLCTATAFVGMDGLFINICNHIAAQFRIIGIDVENLTAEIRGKHSFFLSIRTHWELTCNLWAN